MTTDPIAAALDHIRSITTADNPWTADDVSYFSPWEPDESDYAIATILNAVVSGQLINRASRDEMLAQVRRGEGFATAGAEARWIADSEAGVYGTDAPDPIAAARALIEPLTGYTPGPWRKHGNGKQIISSDAIIAPRVWGAAKANTRLIAAAPDLRDMIATLADALEVERAENLKACAHLASVLVERDALVAAAYETAASAQVEGMDYCSPPTKAAIRALTPADAQAALNKMLAEARLEGWRAGRDAAARSCVLSGQDLAEGDWGPEGRDMAAMLVARILALPEPKEASHE